MLETMPSMRAIALTKKVDVGCVAENLRMVDVPVPKPGPNEVVIKLAASSIHIDEIYAAQGTALGRFYGPKSVSEEEPYILGSSVSGTVVGLGRDVDDMDLGTSVIVIPAETMEHGSWANYRCVARPAVLPKPEELSHVQAAAITMAACVAFGAVGLGAVSAQSRCLVVGASGAIGLLMLQMLKAAGAYVVGVCSERNAKMVLEHGADEIIDYTVQDFGTAQPKFDAVFDTIGGMETEKRALRALSKSGRFVTIVGPIQHIGETKLSWSEFIRTATYILWRSVSSRVFGRRYVFCAQLPRKTIRAALKLVIRENIQMATDRIAPFELSAIKDAINHLTQHRAKGRIVIDFELTPELASKPHKQK